MRPFRGLRAFLYDRPPKKPKYERRESMKEKKNPYATNAIGKISAPGNPAAGDPRAVKLTAKEDLRCRK